MSKLAASVASFVFLFLGCGDDPSSLMQPDDLLRGPGGEEWFEPDEYDQYFARMAEWDSVASGTEPLWTGQTALFEGVALECPLYVFGPDYAVRNAETGERIVFSMNPLFSATYVGPRPSGTMGVPAGEFRAPDVWHSVSTDGEWRAFGGSLYGECHGQYVRTPLLVKVWRGRMRWYHFDGLVEGGGGGAGGEEGGWGAMNEDASGQGPAWYTALNKWLSGEGCTKGYEVWVDGGRVCDGRTDS